MSSIKIRSRMFTLFTQIDVNISSICTYQSIAVASCASIDGDYTRKVCNQIKAKLHNNLGVPQVAKQLMHIAYAKFTSNYAMFV